MLAREVELQLEVSPSELPLPDLRVRDASIAEHSRERAVVGARAQQRQGRVVSGECQQRLSLYPMDVSALRDHLSPFAACERGLSKIEQMESGLDLSQRLPDDREIHSGQGRIDLEVVLERQLEGRRERDVRLVHVTAKHSDPAKTSQRGNARGRRDGVRFVERERSENRCGQLRVVFHEIEPQAGVIVRSRRR